MQRPVLLQVCQPAQSDADSVSGREAVSAGFDGIEIVLEGSHEPASLTAESGAPIVAVAATCASTDLAGGVAEISSLLRRTALCHARCLNLTFPPVATRATEGGFARYQEAVNFASRVLHALRYEAEGVGVAIGVEAATGGCWLSPVELREIINEANSSAVGVCLDAARVARIGSPVDWIATLGHRLSCVRVQVTDSAQGGGSSVEDDAGAIASALDAARYKGPVIISGRGEAEELSGFASRLGLGGRMP